MRVYFRFDDYAWHPRNAVGEYIVIYKTSGSYFLKDGQCHNENGAAIYYPDGNKEYILKGKKYHNIPSDEYWIRYQKLLAFQ